MRMRAMNTCAGSLRGGTRLRTTGVTQALRIRLQLLEVKVPSTSCGE
jgi:hypothetical protein